MDLLKKIASSMRAFFSHHVCVRSILMYAPAYTPVVVMNPDRPFFALCLVILFLIWNRRCVTWSADARTEAISSPDAENRSR